MNFLKTAGGISADAHDTHAHNNGNLPQGPTYFLVRMVSLLHVQRTDPDWNQDYGSSNRATFLT